MNVLVPSVILIGRPGPRTVGESLFTSGIGMPVSASFGTTTATVAPVSSGFSITGFLSGLTDAASKIATPLLNLSAQKAQLSAQTALMRAQTDAQIAALRQPTASTPIYLNAPGGAAGNQAGAGMSTGTKVALGVGAAALIGGAVLLSRRGR